MDAKRDVNTCGSSGALHGIKHVSVLKTTMKRFSPNETEAMAAILKRDGCLSVPTDTVYGVCARISEAGQQKLYEVKNRPLSKQFPIMCCDIEQAETVAEMDDAARQLMSTLMPGPLTVILKKKADAPSALHGETLAVRLATSEPLHRLIQAVGTPIFLTSANQSGQKECQSLDEIEQACPKLDGMMEGSVSFGQASTIVNCSNGSIRILREGPITIEQIQKAIGGK